MQFAEVRKKFDLELMTRYSGEGNFHSNDEEARKAGFAGAIVQGGQLTAYLNEMMYKTFDKGFLESGDIAVTFIKQVTSADTVSAHGEVKETAVIDGRKRVECDIWLQNGAGEKVTVGVAHALLPD